jgi:excisionase family DNA binding protein
MNITAIWGAAFALSIVLEPISAKNEEAAVEAFGEALRVVRPHARLIAPDGKEIPIPSAIYKVLEQVIPLLLSDNAVSIVPVATLLTTQEAADLLNVSRPYLIKLLDQGKIKFERSKEPGSHRKIRFVDLMEYKHKIDMERRKLVRKLTEMSQEAGFYDE